MSAPVIIRVAADQVFVGITVRVTWILPVLLHHNGAPLSASLASSWWPVLLLTPMSVSFKGTGVDIYI